MCEVIEKQKDFVIRCLKQQIALLLPSIDSDNAYILACFIEQEVDAFDTIGEIPGIVEKFNVFIDNEEVCINAIAALDRCFQLILEAMFLHHKEIMDSTFGVMQFFNELTEEQKESLRVSLNKRPHVPWEVKTAL